MPTRSARPGTAASPAVRCSARATRPHGMTSRGGGPNPSTPRRRCQGGRWCRPGPARQRSRSGWVTAGRSAPGPGLGRPARRRGRRRSGRGRRCRSWQSSMSATSPLWSPSVTQPTVAGRRQAAGPLRHPVHKDVVYWVSIGVEASDPTLGGTTGLRIDRPRHSAIRQLLHTARVDGNLNRVARRPIKVLDVNRPASVTATGLTSHFYGQPGSVVVTQAVQGERPRLEATCCAPRVQSSAYVGGHGLHGRPRRPTDNTGRHPVRQTRRS